MLIKENPKQECCQLLSKITGISNCKCYREIGWRYFPVISTCTLQGFSGTQGNPVIFTVNTFAVSIVCPEQNLEIDLNFKEML